MGVISTESDIVIITYRLWRDLLSLVTATSVSLGVRVDVVDRTGGIYVTTDSYWNAVRLYDNCQ